MRRDIIVIGGSAGALDPLLDIIRAMRAHLPAAPQFLSRADAQRAVHAGRP